MKNLQSLGKLRGLRDEAASKMVDNPRWVCAKAEEIADEIEAEISERYMELPLDADGVPIRFGDLLDCKAFAHDGEECKSAKVTQFRIDEDETDVMVVLTFDNGMWTCRSVNTNECRHVKPRTLEDALRECGKRYYAHMTDNYMNYDGTDDQLIAKYADEIRAMFGGDAS